MASPRHFTDQDDAFIPISQILKGECVGPASVRGWVHHKRNLGGVIFLLLRDGTGIMQVKISRDRLGERKFRAIADLPVESAVEISGETKKDVRSPGGFEIWARSFEIQSPSIQEFPIARKSHEPDFLLSNRHLWLRNEKMQTIMTLRGRILKTIRHFLEQNGYLETHMPTLVSAACEGGSTLFEVKYFNHVAYLTQSWQLYAEAAIVSLGKIYTIAPSFRAEKSRTTRHLSEFWHLEVEQPWCDLEGIMEVEERLLAHTCRNVAKEMAEHLEGLGRNPEDMLKIRLPLERITYDRALNILSDEGICLEWGSGLGWQEEKAIAKTFSDPFFITHYPKETKAFYHKSDPSRPQVTLSADLIAPEGYGEIAGGGQRIDDLDMLLDRLREEQKSNARFNPEDYDWYADLRRYGSIQHSGFGLGVERLVAWICKLSHIRDAIPFPRLRGRRIWP